MEQKLTTKQRNIDNILIAAIEPYQAQLVMMGREWISSHDASQTRAPIIDYIPRALGIISYSTFCRNCFDSILALWAELQLALQPSNCGPS